MADEIETEVEDLPIPGSEQPAEHLESPAEPEVDDKPDQPKKMSVRESILAAMKPTEEKKDVKPPAAAAKPGAAKPGQKSGAQGSSPQPNAQAAQGSTPDKAEIPAAWKSKELTQIWSQLSPVVQAAVTKREADMTKGVEQLKTRYQELDGAVTPYRETIKRFGFTEAQAVDQLFKWQMALAGPQKIQAFVALLKSHGVDPATFAAAISGNGGAAPQPNNQIQDQLNGISQKISQFEQQAAQQTHQAAEQTVMTWAKDKPHFEKVKALMGQLIQAGVAKPSEGDPFALEAAYNMATRTHPEVSQEILQEHTEAALAARRAAADKARKAGSSMRSGAPVPPSSAQPNGRDQRNETVRDSIRRALSDLRQ